MGFYNSSLAVVGGVCLATGLFHLFIGLRRQGTDMKHMPFALAHGGAVLTGMLVHRATTLPRYLAAGELAAVACSILGNHKILIAVSQVVIENASIDNDQVLSILC
jgi:hypothetical protein